MATQTTIITVARIRFCEIAGMDAVADRAVERVEAHFLGLGSGGLRRFDRRPRPAVCKGPAARIRRIVIWDRRASGWVRVQHKLSTTC